MNVRLRPITLDECVRVGVWRSAPDVAPMLRTGPKTAEDQERFYREIVCNPASGHRYWAVDSDDGLFAGITGLTYLNEVTHEAEISLVLGPHARGHGIGRASVDAVLSAGFHVMGLEAITGECYPAGAVEFWLKQATRHRPVVIGLPPEGGLLWRWLKA